MVLITSLLNSVKNWEESTFIVAIFMPAAFSLQTSEKLMMAPEKAVIGSGRE